MNSLLELGSLLSSKRNDAKISLKKLASKCGMSDSTLSLIERGKAKAPSVLQIYTVANALSIQPSEIFEALGYKTAHADDSACIFQNVTSLSEEDIKTAQAFIDFLASRSAMGDKGANK